MSHHPFFPQEPQSKASNRGIATSRDRLPRLVVIGPRHLRTDGVLDRAGVRSREVGDAATQEHHHGHP
jgi:hypothetical protein